MGKRRKKFRRAQLAEARKKKVTQNEVVPVQVVVPEPDLAERVIKKPVEEVIEEISVEVFTPTPEISPEPVHATALVEDGLTSGGTKKPVKKEKKKPQLIKAPARSRRSRYRKAVEE